MSTLSWIFWGWKSISECFNSLVTPTHPTHTHTKFLWFLFYSVLSQFTFCQFPFHYLHPPHHFHLVDLLTTHHCVVKVCFAVRNLCSEIHIDKSKYTFWSLSPEKSTKAINSMGGAYEAEMNAVWDTAVILILPTILVNFYKSNEGVSFFFFSLFSSHSSIYIDCKLKKTKIIETYWWRKLP